MGGNEDGFCHFDLTLNSGDRGVIDSCDTFSFCRDRLRRVARSEIAQGNLYLALESILLLASRILALPCPPLGTRVGGGGGKREKRGAGSILASETGAT